jgi:hypothetical protein
MSDQLLWTLTPCAWNVPLCDLLVLQVRVIVWMKSHGHIMAFVTSDVSFFTFSVIDSSWPDSAERLVLLPHNSMRLDC